MTEKGRAREIILVGKHRIPVKERPCRFLVTATYGRLIVNADGCSLQGSGYLCPVQGEVSRCVYLREVGREAIEHTFTLKQGIPWMWAWIRWWRPSQWEGEG